MCEVIFYDLHTSTKRQLLGSQNSLKRQHFGKTEQKKQIADLVWWNLFMRDNKTLEIPHAP